MLDSTDTALVLIDVQGRLAQLMFDKAHLFSRLETVVSGVRLLDVPLLCTEQIPDKLGPTIPGLMELMPDVTPIPKTAFSCWGEPAFREQLEALGRNCIVLAGIETHVCVVQTALDLVNSGYSVQVVADAVSSRDQRNREAALRRMQAAGVCVTTVEMVLFELMRDATHPAFRDLLRLVK